MAETFRTSDDIEIAYVRDDFTDPWKGAPTLVMVHSAMGNAGRYFGMVPTLARHFKVVRMDMRGFGRSEVPGEDKPVTMERLVADLSELIDHLGLDRVHLLGNSAGGYVCQHMAMWHPERVESLILFGSTAGLKGTSAGDYVPGVKAEGLRPYFARTIAYRFDEGADPAFVEWFLDDIAKNDVPYIARFVGLMTSLEWSGELHRIRCPTLIVIPGAEVENKARSYDTMRDGIADVTLVTYPGMKHNICDSVPDRCARDALEFLSKRFLAA